MLCKRNTMLVILGTLCHVNKIHGKKTGARGLQHANTSQYINSSILGLLPQVQAIEEVASEHHEVELVHEQNLHSQDINMY